jgi:hypothetical protein
MLSPEDCLKSVNFAPGQKLAAGMLRMPGVITQLSPADQWPSPEVPTLQVSVIHPLQRVSSPGMICLPDLLSSFNVTCIHPRAPIETLLPQRSTSFCQTDVILSTGENNTSILTIKITPVQVADGRPSANGWNFSSIIAYQLVAQGASRCSINHCITIRSAGN